MGKRLLKLCFHVGRALLALGRKQEAVLVLEQGYNIALQQTADVKQLLELDVLNIAFYAFMVLVTSLSVFAYMFSDYNFIRIPPEELYATQLQQLEEMGFFDRAANIRALRATNGNVTLL
ncbi:hypothetical protein DY000_02036508 [Brassica cretica]|uniref:UBA domain-containing protein n=1 Tax=Brassica cretica TaxID=69181 RepID=A0ABQ7B8X0_BRACR|nr:hypothetical protein DY000_02036508 [Brassica cretica]